MLSGSQEVVPCEHLHLDRIVPTLVHVTTVPQSLIFVSKQMKFMQDHGFDIHIVSSPGELLDEYGRDYGVTTHPLPMSRAISPAADAIAVMRLTRLLKRIKPDIVHAHTPKGGLVGMTAATAARVPSRIYHMRGLLTLTATGRKKALLSAAEVTSCEMAHTVICQSRSLRRVAVDDHLVDPVKAVVLGDGSNGVDAQRFAPQPDDTLRQEVRAKFGIPEDAVVIGFVGRLVGDKGIVELTRAWSGLRDRFPHLHLLLVGPFEERDPVPAHTRQTLEGDDRVHFQGFTKDTVPYYAAMDVLTLPTYREGFPNVPLEAAAMGLPVVGTFAVGCRDAIANGQTGILVRERDAKALEEAIGRYVAFPHLRTRHGDAGRERVLEKFTPGRIQEALLDVYLGLMST